MNKDEWFERVLADCKPFEDLSHEENGALYRGFVNPLRGREFAEDLQVALAVLRATSDIQVLTARLLSIGEAVGRATAYFYLSQSAGGEVEPPTPLPGLDPSLAELILTAESVSRMPDVARLHADTQAALLRAIRDRAADATAEELNVLADAYLRIPAPESDPTTEAGPDD